MPRNRPSKRAFFLSENDRGVGVMAGQKGRSGRKKAPAAVKELRGTERSDRHSEQVHVPAGVPLPPEELRDDVQQEWLRLAPVLAERGLLTEADFLAWEMGMRIYSLWRDAYDELLTTPQVEMSEKGNAYAHPLVWIEKSHSERVLKFCDRFGLTPSARNGLQPMNDEGKEVDPLEGMLNG